MYISLCLFSVFAIVTCSSIVDRGHSLTKHQWQLFKSTHGKNYENADVEQYRMKIFIENKKKIERHNELAKEGKKSYVLRMNRFGDMSSDEIVEQMTGFKVSPEKRNAKTFPLTKKVSIPVVVDWREKGYVTPVKAQGPCGSGWAFSATGAVEGQHFKKTGELISLSEQNLVDCAVSNGCAGALVNQAYAYIQNNGVDTEVTYPYEGREGSCRFDVNGIGASVTGFVNIPKGNETSLAQAAAIIGPISVAIDASHYSFHFYHKGIYDEPKCSQIVANHAVLVVGYGPGYFLVKNSWGTEWGAQGYIKMSRNKNNQCGIASYASYPTIN